jgi:hypothetical protein
MALWSVIANEVKQSIPAHHSRMDRFVPRDDESGVMALWSVIANEVKQSIPPRTAAHLAPGLATALSFSGLGNCFNLSRSIHLLLLITTNFNFY